MNNGTGFNEAKVNNAITRLKTKSDAVLEELTNQYKNILKELGDNWGTQDSIQYVEDNVLPAFRETGRQIAEALKAIGTTISNVANAQASDTGNAVEITTPTASEVGELLNKQKEKLDNGYVGAYENLISDVSKASALLKTEVNEKLTSLRTDVIGLCESAFTSQGTSQVATELDSKIGEINTKISTALTQMESDVNTLTANADKFVKDIQAAGLRQTSSN